MSPPAAYEFNRREQTFPEELVSRYGSENLFAVMPCQSRRAPAVWDDTTASGYAVRVAVPNESSAMKLWTVRVGTKDNLPWHDVVITDLRQPMLRPKEADKIRREGGWHLVRVGRAKLSESGMAALPTLPNRSVRFFLGEFYDPEDPNRKFDIYLSFKDGGGIGGGAQMALDEIGVKVVGGASGKVADVVAAFLKGELEVNPDFQCHHHDHDSGHKCGEHGCGEHKCGGSCH